VELPLQELLRREVREVGRDPDSAPVELQEFDLFLRLIGAKDQAQRSLLPGP
jgi:hypothetical protein